MEIEVLPIKIEQKSVFIQMMELCNYDFSEYEDSDINEYGYYGYSHIDDYWNEEGRFPYFVRVNRKLAGFALVCSVCRNISGSNARCISEFFIMAKYRRMGVGKFVAKNVFDKHRGLWEVNQMSNNIRAQKFWGNVISDYTSNNFKETGSINEEWVGFTFDNSCTL